MLDALPLSGWELTGWGIVALVVVMLLRYVASILRAILAGQLVTRREVESEKVRADTWQAAWQVAQEAHREKDEALASLLPMVATSVRILEFLQAAAMRRGDHHEEGAP